VTTTSIGVVGYNGTFPITAVPDPRTSPSRLQQAASPLPEAEPPPRLEAFRPACIKSA